MRSAAMAVLALLSLGASGAQANPMVVERMLVDFNPPLHQYRIDPEPAELVQAYVMVDLSSPIPEGLKAISFALSVTPAMAGSVVFTNLLDSADGDWQTGITLSTLGCIEVFPVAVAKLSFTYLGVPGDVTIIDHPLYPRWFVDCSNPGNILIYCVESHGGVGKPPLAGDCWGNPVENVSWGAIKALYVP